MASLAARRVGERPSVQYLVPAGLTAIRCALVAVGAEVFGEVLEDRFGSGVRLAHSWPGDEEVGEPEVARTEDICAHLVLRTAGPGPAHVEVATEARTCAAGGCCDLVEPAHWPTQRWADDLETYLEDPDLDPRVRNTYTKTAAMLGRNIAEELSLPTPMLCEALAPRTITL